MANKVTIDVEARFVDNVTSKSHAASQAIEEIGKDAKQSQKQLDELGRKKVKPIFDADNSRLLKKLKAAEDKAAKLGRTKTEVVLKALDKATNVIGNVLNKAQRFAGKTFSALIKIRDSEALSTVRKITTGLESLTKNAWTAVIKVKDFFTAPIRRLKESLFSVKNLISTIVTALAAGFVTKKLVADPVGTADSIESSRIAFESKLGSSVGAENFLKKIYKFDEKSPFDTLEIVGITQQMMNLGWTAETVLDDLGTIGDWSASMGKGEEGIAAVTRALGQMRMKGKLSSEEMLQLTEAGVSAWQYLANYMGKDITEVRELAEDGAIDVDTAIKGIMAGMGEYSGAAASLADRTVGGLIDQVKALFNTYVKLPWGEGLGAGFKDALVDVRDLIDENKDTLKKFCETAKEIGSKISSWFAEKVGNAMGRLKDIIESFEFKEAGLGEKLKMLWNGIIVDPLKEWWTEGGQQKTAETAGKIGAWLGTAITKGLLAVFGIADIFDSDEADRLAENGGMSIAQSFADGFLDNFDGSAITDAFVKAISNIWNALPWWAKILIGGYGAGKLVGGISSFAGGIANFISGAGRAIGGFNIASSAFPILTSSGSGILGAIGKTGVALGASTTGGALLAGAGGIAGGVAGGAALIKGGIDLYKGYTTDDKIEREARLTSGASAIGGVAAGAALGAAIGSIVPVIGTALGALIGAGVGGVVGWIKGNKDADEIRASRYESEELQKVLKDNKATSEEIQEAWAKAKWENAKKHFNGIKLTLSEIERLTDQIVWGDSMGKYDTFSSALKKAEENFQSMKASAKQVNRWMWKAGLGVKFNKDEMEEFKLAVDEYISSAKSFVENKHYEFTAAVSLLLDVESEDGKAIIGSGNSFYGGLKKQLDTLGTELSDTLDDVLDDGVISTDDKVKIKIDGVEYELNEQYALSKLQAKIAEITNMLAESEQQARIELIRVKFGSGNLDLESFESFMTQMRSTIDERMTATDDAFIASVSSLKLQLEKGAIQPEEYNKQLQALIDGYKGTVNGLRADVQNVELQIIGEAYAEELGGDAAADLEKALQYAIENEIDPVEIPYEKLIELLNVDSLSAETADNIKEMLSGTLSHLELLEIDGNLLLSIGNVTTDSDVVERVKQAIPQEYEATVELLLTGDKELLNKIDVTELAAEFGIPEEQAKTIIEKLTGEKEIQNRLNILASDFGIPDVITKTVQIKVTGNVTTYGNPQMSYASKQAQLLRARGGIVGGGSSAMEAFARGGIVGGSTRFIRVNEESPEMIIPLSSQRRERAMKLWMKTGEMLDVPGFARGGITGGGRDEGIRFNNYDSSDSVGGQTVQIEVGGITVEIHVDATGTENISEAIKAQSEEIAETVAGILADALGGQFENTPTRGGAA